MNNMKLPEGKTAETCIHFYRCSKMFGCQAKNTSCDFAPSRYVEKTPTSDNSECTVTQSEIASPKLTS